MYERERERERERDLWRRGQCGRTQSRGSLGSCRSACRRCYRRRPCATFLGVFLGLSLHLPSTCSSPLSQRTEASPHHYYFYYDHENDDVMKMKMKMKTKTKTKYSFWALTPALWFCLVLCLERKYGSEKEREGSRKVYHLLVIMSQPVNSSPFTSFTSEVVTGKQ